MPADLHRIFAVWRNHFPELVIVHWFNNVRQTAVHTAEPLVLESSVLEFEVAIEKLNGLNSPSVDQIPAELIKTGARKICSANSKLINYVWKKEELYINYNTHTHTHTHIYIYIYIYIKYKLRQF